MGDGHPQFEGWLEEIKAGSESRRIGMYLMHNGVVRGTARDGTPVTGMDLSYDRPRLGTIITEIQQRPGVVAVKAWINEGHLAVGDDIAGPGGRGHPRERLRRPAGTRAAGQNGVRQGIGDRLGWNGLGWNGLGQAAPPGPKRDWRHRCNWTTR